MPEPEFQDPSPPHLHPRPPLQEDVAVLLDRSARQEQIIARVEVKLDEVLHELPAHTQMLRNLEKRVTDLEAHFSGGGWRIAYILGAILISLLALLLFPHGQQIATSIGGGG